MKLETIKQAVLGDERAVSPVIGVILMVAITVILAAVIGTFVLGLGENVSQQTPQASMSFSDAPNDNNPDAATDNFINMEHSSGDPLNGDEVKINVRDAGSNELVATWNGANWVAPTGTYSGVSGGATINGNAFGASSTIGVGDLVTITMDGDSSNPADGKYKVTVIHKPSDSTIASGTVSVS